MNRDHLLVIDEYTEYQLPNLAIGTFKITDILKKYMSCYEIYRCPRVLKKLHNLFVIKDINFFFILDDSYVSTAYSENIAVYIQSVPIL
jgi:hypothetical protein